MGQESEMNFNAIDDSAKALPRVCRGCEVVYRVRDYEPSKQYFDAPYGYDEGYSESCLSCWLGIEPESLDNILGNDDVTDDAATGDLLLDFYDYLRSGHHLAHPAMFSLRL